MLVLPREAYEQIVAHARREHPDEACGLVAGRAGRVTRVMPMDNIARSPTFYEMDPAALLRAFRDMDDNDEDLLVIYHSHTATEAYPSRTDVSIAGYPEAHYALVSTRTADEAEFRSYRIREGVVEEEEVQVVDNG